MIGCVSRAGCALILALLLIVVLGAGVAAYLATRSVGPAYSNGSYTVKGDNGVTRVDHISASAAASFEAKPGADRSPAALLRLQRAGIDYSEEEVNSELAQELTLQPVEGNGIDVQRVFLELHTAHPTIYVYGKFLGVQLTLSAGVTFAVQNGSVLVSIHDPRAGSLPISVVLPTILDKTGNMARVQQVLTQALPKQVAAIEPQEGSLHVALNLFSARQGGLPRYALWPGSSITSGSAPVGSAPVASAEPVFTSASFFAAASWWTAA